VQKKAQQFPLFLLVFDAAKAAWTKDFIRLQRKTLAGTAFHQITRFLSGGCPLLIFSPNACAFWIPANQ